MTISNYGELKTAIANWMANSTLTARIPEFVSIAQGYLNYGIMGPNGWMVEPLRIRAMETSSDVAVTAGTATIPTGYLAAKRFYLSTSPIVTLDYFPPVDFWAREFANEAGQPQAFTTEGDSFILRPSGDYTAKLLYYKAFTALNADADTNWLLTNQPGAYLFGALYEAFNYQEGGQDEAAAYLQRFSSVVNALNGADKADRASGAILQMRTGTAP